MTPFEGISLGDISISLPRGHYHFASTGCHPRHGSTGREELPATHEFHRQRRRRTVPFAKEWQIDDETWSQAAQGLAVPVPNTPVAQLLGLQSGFADKPSPPTLSLGDRDTITKLGELDQGVAVSLDKAVNGTSLMVILRIGSRYLLFPGDAQWGSWQTALRNDETRRLLEKTTFYKVGHHGSHNATPVEFVEEVVKEKGDVPAMISTRPIEKWPDIPRQPLIDALTLRGCRCVRSDAPETAATGVFRVSGKSYVELDIP